MDAGRGRPVSPHLGLSLVACLTRVLLSTRASSTNEEPSKTARAAAVVKSKALEVIQETAAPLVPPTPAADLRDVSMMLKSPFSVRGSGPPVQPATPDLLAEQSGPILAQRKTLLDDMNEPIDEDVPNMLSAVLNNAHEASTSTLQRLTAMIPRSTSPVKMLEAVQPQAEQVVGYVKERHGVALQSGTSLLASTQKVSLIS
jgi:hypothetical protein